MIVWLFKMFKNLFFILDSAILNFIPRIYDLLISISRTSILSQADIKDFSDRIQLLLGIFMLFKVSFSLIMYVVNPDDFSDQSKGIGKLAQNTVISLVLLVIVPYIFVMAYRLQVLILEDNTLARLILPDSGSGSNVSYINTAGDDMAFSIMLPFFSPNTSLTLSDNDMTSCVSLYTASKDGDGKTTIDENCKKAIKEAFYGSRDKYEARKADDEAQTYATNYIEGIQNRSLGLTFRIQAATQTYTPDGGEEQFVIDYPWPFTTIVAAIVVLLLVNFCLDIGLRSVKLAFLQLIAPIPIISYMDPKSGKDGLFGKWYKMCISTYISLFVRLAALYFGVYLISKVGRLTDIVNGSEQTDFFVQVFIIIGVLMFVKQLPKILENLGIKLDGDGKFNLNPLKKMEGDVAGYGGIKRGAGRAGAAALGFAGGAAANAWATRGNWKGQSAKERLKNLGSIFGGGTSGLARGAVSKEKNVLKAGRAGIKGAVDKRNLRDQRQATGYNFRKRATAGMDRFAGHDPAEKYERQIEGYENIEKQGKAILDHAEGEMYKHNDLSFKFKTKALNGDDIEATANISNLKTMKENLTTLRSQDTSGMNESQLQERTNKIITLEQQINDGEKAAKFAYVNEAIHDNKYGDNDLQSMINGLASDVRSSSDVGINNHSTASGSDIKDLVDDMDTLKKKVINDDEYKRIIKNKKSE